MSLTSILVRGDEGRGVEEQARVPADALNLVAVRQQEGFHVTAMAAKRDIVTVGIGEGRGAFHVEGDVVLGEVTAEGEFHSHACHDAAETVVGRAAHAVVGVRKRAHRVRDPAFDEVAWEGEAEEGGGVHEVSGNWRLEIEGLVISHQ